MHPGLAALPAARARADPRRRRRPGAARGAAVPGRCERVTLVDLDPEMTRLFSTHPRLRRLNGGALADPRVRVVNADAFVWLDDSRRDVRLRVVDFPDPTNFALGKLYTTTFYRLLCERLSPDATFVVQATSPLFARQAYWCIVATIEQAGLAVAPYHVYVPSFGEWGFVLAGRTSAARPPRAAAGPALPDRRRACRELFDFPADMARVPVRAEPAEHAGARALLRARVERRSIGEPARRAVSFLADARCVGPACPKSGRRILDGRLRQRSRRASGISCADRVRVRRQPRADDSDVPRRHRRRRHRRTVAPPGGSQKRGFDDFVLLEMEREAGRQRALGRERGVARIRGARTTCRCPGKAAGLVRELFDRSRRVRRHDAGTSGTCARAATSACSSTAAGRRGSSRRSGRRGATAISSRASTSAMARAARHRPASRSRWRRRRRRAPPAEDALSMAAWLDREGLDSPWLRWFVDYACRDDYGALAARRLGLGRHPLLRGARRRRRRGPLTWPEGNGWIVAAPAASGSGRACTPAQLAYRIERRGRALARADAAAPTGRPTS